MFTIGLKIIFCLLLAAILGFIIGYLFCKSRCNKENDTYDNMEVIKPKAQSEEPAAAPAKLADDFKPKSVKKEEITPDDLTKIKGVGEKIQTALNELGVFTFSQIASWNEDNVAWVDEYLVFKGRIKREDWINQAKILANGGETEFSKRHDS